MRQIIFPIIATLLMVISASSSAFAQYEKPGNIFSHAGTFSLQLPLAVFQRSHLAGAGLSYAWSKARFGEMIQKRKLIGFTGGGGLDMFFGKQTETADYKFKYDSYLYFYLKAGIIANPFPNTQLLLTGGPGLGLYEGEAKAGLFSELAGNYFVSERLAFGPGLQLRKQAKTDALWAISIRASYTF